jgi:(1->4)-alpha-D-glucan 1-alpha-D-glucosylmutase
VPDFFQGTETWTLTLVDPDNRRPVDFEQRAQRLRELGRQVAHCLSSPGQDPVETWLDRCLTHDVAVQTSASIDSRPLCAELLAERADGRIKLFCTQFALRLRRRLPELFTSGAYEPLSAIGAHADNVVAFARTHSGQAVVAVAPRLTVRLTGFGGPPPLGEFWEDSALVLPDDLAQREWSDVFTGLKHRAAQGGGIPVAGLFAQLPFALLVAAPK